MKDASRLLRKLRRKVYREVPIATWNRAAEVDWRGSYDTLISTFRRGDCGVLSGGAALALWRAATDAGFRAWCYDFGFPESLAHMVTVVELDGRLRVHDPFLNLGYRADFYEILEGLRADRLPDIRHEQRDRKVYIVDPSCESQVTVDWLTAHADRELDRIGSLRRFEVLWDRDALLATLARPEAVYRDLETRGYPADLSYLMLHPIGVFDGSADHQNPETMPLIGGRDLRSPVAGLRAAMQQLTQDLAVERDQLAEKSAISDRLESELAEARSQLLAASGEAELAEATAGHAAATEEVRRLADQVVQLRSAYDDAERRIATERELFLRQQQKLEAALGETSAHAAAIEAQAQGWEQTIRTLQDATDQRNAEWEGERRSLQKAAQVLEDDGQQLRAEVLEAWEDLAKAHGQIAEMRDTLTCRIAEWGGERRSLQEAAQALEDDKRQLQAEVAETGKHLVAARGQIAGLGDTLDRRTAEWDGERQSLQETAQMLEDNNQQLHAGVLEAQEDLAKAHRRLRDVENQAAWSALQITELVEKDAAAVSELAQRRGEVDGFVSAAKRLLAVDELPSAELLAVLGHLRQHLRETERELDRAEAERDRLRGVLSATASRKRPSAGRLRGLLRGLLAWRRGSR